MSLAAQIIKSGDDQCIMAGGAESMSNAPYYANKVRWGARMNDIQMVDLMVHDGVWDIFNGYHMGITAENVAEQYGITREMQDELALASQQKAAAAIKAGKKMVKSVGLFDVYRGDKIPQGKKQYAMSFVLQDPDKTLTDQDTERIMNNILGLLTKEYGAAIR